MTDHFVDYNLGIYQVMCLCNCQRRKTYKVDLENEEAIANSIEEGPADKIPEIEEPVIDPDGKDPENDGNKSENDGKTSGDASDGNTSSDSTTPGPDRANGTSPKRPATLHGLKKDQRSTHKSKSTVARPRMTPRMPFKSLPARKPGLIFPDSGVVLLKYVRCFVLHIFILGLVLYSYISRKLLCRYIFNDKK